MHKLGMGGGCHWCTEAVFQSSPEVSRVQQGYITSISPYDTFSEGVIIHFENWSDLELLVDIHLQTHSSTLEHSRRREYRSAIYYFQRQQKHAVEEVMVTLSRNGARGIHDHRENEVVKRNFNSSTNARIDSYITKILPFAGFKPSRESIQNYYATRPDAPFCKRYIQPKLDKISRM